MEQEEYWKEEITWSYIEFVDNQDVLDLIEKKPGGVIALLDEACMFPKSTHETFAQKLYQTLIENTRFSKPKLSRTAFSISHYAGEVTYQADYFLDKNKDYVISEHQELLSNSKCPFVSNLFPPLPMETSKSSKFSSIGSCFKVQLKDLMDTLNSTQPQYVRCIKPNNVLKPAIFENSSIIQQLRCAGVLEAIRISCAGYPTRRTFYEFLSRFRVLALEVLEKNLDCKIACQKILDKSGLKGYQIGKTKVFLRAGQMAELDAKRAEVLGRAARTIQRQFHTFIAHREFLLLRSTAIYLQSFCRGRLACILYENKRREAAAAMIQKNLRRDFAKTSYSRLRLSAIALQTGLRMMAALNALRFAKQSKAAVTIQANWRCHVHHQYYIKLKKAALTCQCARRCVIARRELKHLKMAAREAGALKEAKDKLEKRVEELAWHLQLEKRIRTNLEETKAQEIAKLQESLREMQVQVEQTNFILPEEREAARKAIQEAPQLIKGIPVVVQDTERIDSLTTEIERLKALSAQEKDATSAARQANAELQEKNSALARKLEAAEKKAEELQDSVDRLEEKLSNSVDECRVLRQQAISQTNKNVSTQTTATILQGAQENGKIHDEITNAELGVHPHLQLNKMQSFKKPPKSLNEKHQENKDLLIRCISLNLGFSGGKPIAACTIYKCLLHWRSFESEKTSIFDQLMNTIGSAVEVSENYEALSYWLTNTSTLLLLLQHTLKANDATTMSARQHVRRSPSPMFGKGYHGSQNSGENYNDRHDYLHQVEARYPALLFKQQLVALVEKIYGMLRDDLKKEISPLLASCIQAPRALRGILTKGLCTEEKEMAQRAQVAHWQNIVKCFDSFLQIMKDNYVPALFLRNVFTQVFSFIDIQLFNSLLLRRECCSYSNGAYVKAGLWELERWCNLATELYAGLAYEELNHIKQAVAFLVLHQKSKATLEEIMKSLCPKLSKQQIYRISTMYWDDKYGTHGLSAEVIMRMRAEMTAESDGAIGRSFLLDGDSSIPFSIDDISKSGAPLDISDIEPPPEAGFAFSSRSV